MRHLEDQQIIELFFRRSEEAISRAEEKYGAYCARIAENILRSPEDAQECVNDAFLRAWQSIPPASPGSLGGYLGKIVRNLSLNRRKAEHAQKRGADVYCNICLELAEDLTTPSVEELVDGLLLREAVSRWLAKLPGNKRMVFVGRYWYMDAVETVAAKMGYSVRKTKMMLLRLREDLKAYLIGEGIHL